jgi:inner membrane transporter RhtA
MTTTESPAAASSTPFWRTLLDWIPPWLLVVIAILSVQMGAALATQLFPVAGTNGVVFLRTSLGALIFFTLWRPRVRGYTRTQYVYIVLYGVVIALNMLLFYAAIERIPLGITVAIAFAGPLGVAVIGSRKPIDLLWVALAGVGVLLLSPFTNADLDTWGVVLAVLTAVAWAAYVVLTKRVTHLLPGNDLLALAMAVAALVTLPTGLGGALQIAGFPLLILLAGVVALLSSAIPFGLEFHASKQLAPRVFGMLLAVEPVAAAVIGALFLAQGLALPEVVGIALVTIAAIATTRNT